MMVLENYIFVKKKVSIFSWPLRTDGVTLQPSGRSYNALVKVERSDVGRGHFADAT